MAYLLRMKDKNSANKDGMMDEAQQKVATMWKRGASNAGYHYLGCAKTFALMGKAFAEANLKMMKGE